MHNSAITAGTHSYETLTSRQRSLDAPIFLGITGAQGVGKSTFCRSLHAALSERINFTSVSVLEGLGDSLKASGIALGSAADDQSVAAVYCAHLYRELNAPPGVHILDRCAIDALAYVRCLNVTSEIMSKLYAHISATMAKRLKFVVHLEMTGRFEGTDATHETPALRQRVAREIPLIIAQLKIDHVQMNASDEPSIQLAADAIMNVLNSAH